MFFQLDFFDDIKGNMFKLKILRVNLFDTFFLHSASQHVTVM